MKNEEWRVKNEYVSRAVTLWRLFLICDLRFAGYEGIFAASEVLPRMQGVPLLTAFAAEWWGAAGGNRGRWAAREKTPATARPSPPPISPSSPRLWRTIPRNAPAVSGISRFAGAICEVRCMIGGPFTASERRHARSAINTIRSVVMGMPAPVTGISERCY